MDRYSRLPAALLLAVTCFVAPAALAQKSGGIAKIYHRDSPPSASIHEEATNSTNIPFMPVYNNLVLFDQQAPQNSPDTIVPELAESWSWNAANTELTFKLRQGVKWHDGKPFTARDVQCTWDMLQEKNAELKLRKNPRQGWYHNLDRVSANGDYEATFHLKRPQPSIRVAAGVRLYAGLSVPRVAAGHAHQADRNRPVQGRRIQAERDRAAGEEPGLLEEGQALPRRDRFPDHHQPVDADPGLHRRRVRHDLSGRRDRAAHEGHQDAGAEGQSVRSRRRTSAAT